VVSGTSVGALNGVMIASRSVEGLDRLTLAWQEMEVGRVYRVRASNVVSVVYNSLWSTGAFSLLDARPLYSLVRRLYPTDQLREAVAFGDTRAFIVSATELDTGVNTLFIDSHDPELWLRVPPGTKVRRCHVTPEHCLASAALPLLFEPVAVDGRVHVDGMLRQNTPLRPVIQCGVRSVLVVGVDKPGQFVSLTAPVVPTFAFVAGKALNAVLMDPVDRDLREMQRLNDLIRWGRERFGPEFEASVAQDFGLRDVAVLRLSPSRDLGAIARQAFVEQPPQATATARSLLGLLADPANMGESDLLSYLLFDRAYTAEIERLGYEDARDQEEVLARFFLAHRAMGG
jgi:NTE family protein